MLAGTVMTGAVWSTTVTVNEAEAALPATSTPVKVTVVVPSGKTSPEALLLVTTGWAVQLSATVNADHVTTASHDVARAAIVMFAGTLLHTGSSVSLTVTVKLAEVVFPLLSVAVYVTVVAPTAKAWPGVWVEVSTVPLQLSVNDGASHVTTAEQSPASFETVMFAGILLRTGFRSRTSTQKPDVSEFPFTSTAV
jgi:hypothetical protein